MIIILQVIIIIHHWKAIKNEGQLQQYFNILSKKLRRSLNIIEHALASLSYNSCSPTGSKCEG